MDPIKKLPKKLYLDNNGCLYSEMYTQESLENRKQNMCMDILETCIHIGFLHIAYKFPEGKHEIPAYLLHMPRQVCPDMVLPNQNHIYN